MIATTSPDGPSIRRGSKISTITHSLGRFFSDPKARVGGVIFAVFILMAIFAPWLIRYNPQSTQFAPWQSPNANHWLGTTGTGQDVYSQIVWGSRATLAIGIGAGFVSTFIAIVIGMFGGFLGGWIDNILATFTNIVLVIPGLPLLIVITAYAKNAGSFTIALIIGLTGWAWGARVLRSQVMSIGGRDFVTAARLSGASSWRIVMVEILPNMMALVAANLIYGSLYAILAETGLEFLGLGNVSQITWGTMLYWADAGQALLNGAWWWFVPPGLAIALVGGSFGLLNFAVDQYTNPRLRGKH
ncbi:peptide/nickel transport system permease protein [Sulfobacillus thermosulfidooxidans DSM 9293]|uniref:Peptide/nickel transport system permease protein n=1 Tax=Sulfobacillus thermosulfidooxidans (strain DSM 9293 / VKM B-1269 / AT-1) TaxID=929705 RepID=A0A1W1WF57_SULTA|nr:ABC transporter permease [Sulfobacillus thermosulfidooxidans]SMC04832.1 peptide/nickel transport system permease protein [Sulfobacillus thermosulfidooxidans DSM 9293]